MTHEASQEKSSLHVCDENPLVSYPWRVIMYARVRCFASLNVHCLAWACKKISLFFCLSVFEGKKLFRLINSLDIDDKSNHAVWHSSRVKEKPFMQVLVPLKVGFNIESHEVSDSVEERLSMTSVSSLHILTKDPLSVKSLRKWHFPKEGGTHWAISLAKARKKA